MKTKVIILGQEPKEEKKLKPIEFVKHLSFDLICFEDPCNDPCDFENIELICENYDKGVDLMFAYNEDRNYGFLYAGHFNDGVVE